MNSVTKAKTDEFVDYQTILTTGKTTRETALQWFDSLEPVDLDFMMGRWKGFILITDPKLEDLVKNSVWGNWQGQEFVDADNVHPWLFSDSRGEVFNVEANPNTYDKTLELHKDDFLKLKSSLATTKSQARLLMAKYRGKISATMIYDYLPIYDFFRLVDENTVLGASVEKNSAQPVFCVLRRENPKFEANSRLIT